MDVCGLLWAANIWGFRKAGFYLFHIDSSVQKPNHALAKEYAQRWCERGFRFNRSTWKDILDTANEKRALLLKYGLKNPDSPKEVAWFLRSFNSLEIASVMYDIQKGGWDLTVDAFCEVASRFTGIPEIQALYEYKQAMGTARSFQTLERHLKCEDIVHPKAKVTSTNRIMFVEPFISGLPKVCKPFMPINDEAVLLSVDVKAQEPNIIINWFGSPNLKAVASTETDIYTGVAKAAFLPRVSLIEKPGKSITPVPKGVAWIWGTGDSLLHIENVHQTFLLDNPLTVTGVFESGARRKLPVKWGARANGLAVGELDLTSNKADKLSFRLQAGARDEVKDVWNLLAYGGSLSSAKSLCTVLDGELLVNYLKTELRLSRKAEEEEQTTYFGTSLVSDKKVGYRSVRNRMIQGTGADLMAMLIERFYSERRPEGMDIYLTRYDELVIEVPWAFFNKDSGGVTEYLTDIFEHQVDDFTPFKVDVGLF